MTIFRLIEELIGTITMDTDGGVGDIAFFLVNLN